MLPLPNLKLRKPRSRTTVSKITTDYFTSPDSTKVSAKDALLPESGKRQSSRTHTLAVRNFPVADKVAPKESKALVHRRSMAELTSFKTKIGTKQTAKCPLQSNSLFNRKSSKTANLLSAKKVYRTRSCQTTEEAFRRTTLSDSKNSIQLCCLSSPS